MQWIKAHLNLVIAGSVGLLSLVAIVLGFILPDPVGAMSSDQGLPSSLSSLSGASQSAIEERRALQLQNRAKLLAEQAKQVTRTGTHKPLKSAALLFPKEDPNNQGAAFEFVQEFRRRQQDIIAMLKAGDAPTALEITEVENRMKRAREQDMLEQGKGGGGRNTPAGPGPTPAGPGPAFPTPWGAGGMGAQPVLGPDATPEDRVRQDPQARAAVNKAHSIWCYATVANLDARPSVTEVTAGRPPLDDMWYAQMSLWIQEDILGALAKLNQETAASLPPEECWVGTMPFKRLRAFTIGGIVPPSTGSTTTGGGGFMSAGMSSSTNDIVGPVPMDPTSTMSKLGSSDAVDRLRFTLDFYADAKALLMIINAISTCGFYSVLQVSYEVEPPNLTLTGYIYGAQPVIHVWMAVEGSMLRNEYDKMMPESVKNDIKSGKPVGAGSAATGGGGPSMLPGGGNRMGPMMGPEGGRGVRRPRGMP